MIGKNVIILAGYKQGIRTINKDMNRLIFIFLLVPLLASAQKVDTIPFKNCDKIIVKNNLSADDNFNLVKKILSENEIELISQEKESHQIKTGPISLNSTISPSANYYMIFFTKDNQVSIKSFFRSGLTVGGFVKNEDGYQVVKLAYPKKRNTPFEKMTVIGNGLNGKLYYSSENP